jgi:hypothetical protein
MYHYKSEVTSWKNPNLATMAENVGKILQVT